MQDCAALSICCVCTTGCMVPRDGESSRACSSSRDSSESGLRGGMFGLAAIFRTANAARSWIGGGALASCRMSCRTAIAWGARLIALSCHASACS